jgi:hypothetical protein
MALWLAKPFYEALPYLYMVVGLLLLGGSWLASRPPWPTLLLAAGCLSLLGGLVIWLRRRDYRATQAIYNSHSLDD